MLQSICIINFETSLNTVIHTSICTRYESKLLQKHIGWHFMNILKQRMYWASYQSDRKYRSFQFIDSSNHLYSIHPRFHLLHMYRDGFNELAHSRCWFIWKFVHFTWTFISCGRTNDKFLKQPLRLVQDIFKNKIAIQPKLQETLFYIWYHRFISRISCSQNCPSASLSSFMRLNLTITSFPELVEEPLFEGCGVSRILRVTFSTSVVHAPLKIKVKEIL